MQDIINVNSVKTTYIFFKTLFNIEIMANIYIIDTNSLLICFYIKEYKD